MGSPDIPRQPKNHKKYYKLEKLNLENLNKSLKGLNNWRVEGNSIKKNFKMKGFPETLGFIMAIGALCQAKDHHPDYITFSYSDIEISFSTHSAGGITENDISIAKEIDELKFAY